MRNRFFIPFVGANYSKGIHGKRVLVVGASFYCDQQACGLSIVIDGFLSSIL